MSDDRVPFEDIPNHVKLALIEKVLRQPDFPFGPEDIQDWSRDRKFELFEKMVIAGVFLNIAPPIHTRFSISETESPSYMDYKSLYSTIGIDRRTRKKVLVSQEDRRKGMYLIGTTGTGKSTLLANLILSDIRQGLGVGLIEPHGQLIDTVLGSIPEFRLRDVILLDMADSDYPFGLNLFECDYPTIKQKSYASDFVYHIFQKIWNVGNETPRLMQVLRAITLTLIDNPGTTFAEIPLLFSNETIRRKMVSNLKNSAIVSFWESFERKTQRNKDEYIESTMNKVMGFLDEPIVRNIVSQQKTSVDFRRVIDSQKILLVKLSPLISDASYLIGAIIIGKLLMSSYDRHKQANKPQFNLYCDEYQRFATPDFKTFIEEARKGFVSITLAHQTLSQLDDENRSAAQQAAIKVIFRVSGDDAEQLAKNFDTTPTPQIIGQEPKPAPVSDVITHLIKRGHTDERVSRFSQVYLRKFDNWINNPTRVGRNGPPAPYQRDYYNEQLDLYFEPIILPRSREQLNECLYRSMLEGHSNFMIPPLPLYMLAVAQQDIMREAFAPYVKLTIFGEGTFNGFMEAADDFGHPGFVNRDFAIKFINSKRKPREREAAIAVVSMITELRYIMDALAEDPILVPTGQYQPRYQQRQHLDMERQIVRDLVYLPDHQAKTKLPTYDHEIQTLEPPDTPTDHLLNSRIENIRARMISPQFSYCKYYAEVERDILERHRTWRQYPDARFDEPPPTHT
jgi:hypothetical protein